MKLSLFFYFALITGAPLANADVLFLDMNNSPREIEAARRHGRPVEVFPPVTNEQRRQLDQFKAAELRIGREMQRLDCGKLNEPGGCAPLRERAIAISNNRHQLQKEIAFTPEKFEAFLADRATIGRPFTSVVVSGHDGTGSIIGEFGSISDSQLAEALGRHAGQKEALRALHLWGCYTTSTSSLLLNWKKSFPNVALITGYDGRAPLADKPAGWWYLEAVLKNENRLLAARDARHLQALLRQLRGASLVAAAAYSCGNVASHRDAFNLAEQQQRCAAHRQRIDEAFSQYQCFLKAETAECENPPRNTAAGPVRLFYQILHDTAHCAEIAPHPSFQLANRDQAIRLTLFEAFKQSLGRVHQPQLKEMDEMLDAVGAPANLRFRELAQLSRGEIIRRLDGLLKYLQNELPGADYNPSSGPVTQRDAQLLMLQKFQRTMSTMMVNLDSICVPFSWEDPTSQQKSPCLNEITYGHQAIAQGMAKQAAIKRGITAEAEQKIQREILQLNTQEDSPERADRLRLLRAQSERLSQFLAQESPGPANLDGLDAKVLWAETVLKARQAGHSDPLRSPQALGMALSHNLREVTADDSIPHASILRRIYTLEIELSSAAGENDRRAELAQQLEGAKADFTSALRASIRSRLLAELNALAPIPTGSTSQQEAPQSPMNEMANKAREQIRALDDEAAFRRQVDAEIYEFRTPARPPS